jgi:hypothetical protein
VLIDLTFCGFWKKQVVSWISKRRVKIFACHMFAVSLFRNFKWCAAPAIAWIVVMIEQALAYDDRDGLLPIGTAEWEGVR